MHGNGRRSHPSGRRSRLIVLRDDDADRARALKAVARDLGADAIVVADGVREVARSPCNQLRVGLIHLGDTGPGDGALSLVRMLAANRVQVIAHGRGLASWPLGVQCRALLAGAARLLDSSHSSFLHHLQSCVATLLEAEERAERDRRAAEATFRSLGIVGVSEAMHRLYAWTSRISRMSDFHVLVTGDTGTGKQVFAQAIQRLDPRRRHGPFVVVNSSAISANLAESELFGHRRGAFTGAERDRPGLVRAAHGGVLLLDEIGEMDLALQAKLLRVLQEREFERVGDSNTIRIDVRVIAATHSDLARMVSAGTFREDLYYRLNVLPVQLPPLRDRREDIPLLAQHFLQRSAAETSRAALTVSQEAMRRLMAYRWPGNVRQLENTLERALAFSQGRTSIDVGDLPPDLQEDGAPDNHVETWLPEDGIDFERYIEGVELSLIRRSLERTRGNKRQAARLLNLKRTTLIEKLKRLEAQPAGD
jgi:two-component system, NtrC family, response regulator AtoC